jgi:hypothetical protein
MEVDMTVQVIRYRTKPERADENQRLIEAVFAELAERGPGGLRYESLRLGDGVTFLHVVETDDEGDALTELDAFQDFLTGIFDRCDEPPLATTAAVVGRYSSVEARR